MDTSSSIMARNTGTWQKATEKLQTFNGKKEILTGESGPTST